MFENEFKNLKVGSKVIICRVYNGRMKYTLDKVSKMARATFKCSSIQDNFYLLDGTLRSADIWKKSRLSVMPYTEERWQKYNAENATHEERENLLKSITYYNFSLLTTEQLKAIKAIISPNN